MPEEYPTPSYNFRVEFDIDGIADNSSSFQEASGLSAENDVIAFREGGANLMTYKLDGGARLSNLVLKKGFISDQKIFDWWVDFNTGNSSKAINLKLIILDEDSNPAMTWKINKAFPVAFQAVERQEDKNRFAIEKLELAYESLEILD